MASRIRTDETKCKPPLASRSQSHWHDGGRSGNSLESSLFRIVACFPEQMILNWPKLYYCKHSSPSYKDFPSEYVVRSTPVLIAVADTGYSLVSCGGGEYDSCTDRHKAYRDQRS